jgi:curli biogenesis system outer membrane secretion channel CsgG
MSNPSFLSPRGLALLLTALVTLVTAACTSDATVVSSTGGQTITQARMEPYNGPRYRIAVTAFDDKASNQPAVGGGMRDMLADSLFNSGRFIVLERENLNEVTKEQDISNSNRFRKDTAAPIGQLEGAQLLIRGSITSFEPDCKGGSVILFSAKQSCIGINIRIIDAASGRVLNATTVQGTSANNGVGFVFAGGSLPIGLGAYSKTPMEQAVRDCIEKAVQFIVANKI